MSLTHTIASVAADSSGESTSLSPPFVLCLSVSDSGIVAAGTADGYLLVGFGGEKVSPGKKKRTRKWEGLNEHLISIKIAEGPVVAL